MVARDHCLNLDRVVIVLGWLALNLLLVGPWLLCYFELILDFDFLMSPEKREWGMPRKEQWKNEKERMQSCVVLT